jgi:serine/threonine protein kinase
VKLYEVLDDPHVDKIYIIMEYMKNGSLAAKINKAKTITPAVLWKYFRDIIAGTHYCKISCQQYYIY